ncbi:MAG TPA: sugar O-acetyltransferase [Candidatus Limnocylindria bacterium]|nr:sugar O-acetyltransferase [Candidatus Limnocylindria bacterium]
MGDMRERMLRGELYQAHDPELVEAHRRAADLLFRLNATSNADRSTRATLLHELLGAIGAHSTIVSPFFCDYGTQITAGQRCFVNAGAVMLDGAAVTIGDDVQMGPNVQLLTATHPVDAAERASGWELAQPITIGSGTWLGGGVIVGPGVTVGERTVVGAGAVVVRDLPPDVVAVGNPARVIRRLA